MSLDVCLVALHALPVIRPAAGQPVGGTETRAWTFARGLAARNDTQVRFVVRGPRGMGEFVEGGVRILPRYDRLYSLYESVGHCLEKQPGFPGVKLRRWSPGLLWQLPLLMLWRQFDRTGRDPLQPDAFYQQLEADVFCTFGVQSHSARVIAAAQAAGKPAVLILGSDSDLDARYAADSHFVSQYGDVGWVCHWILRNADAVVTQTPRQQLLLQERFDRDSTVISNPFDLSAWDALAGTELPPELHAGLDRFCLWVGRAETQDKRPQLLLDVARRCPEVTFLMVLNPRDPAVEREIHAARPANVHIVRAVPFDRMPALFGKAAAFVSTSATEGFPNVFLQAAASRVPIGSLDVGEDFLNAAGGGEFCHGDLDRLAAFIRRCWDTRFSKSDSARALVAREHDLFRQAAALRDVLMKTQADR